MSQKKAGSRTLLMSVILSSPGPLVMGLGLLVGQSSTQIADFVRRSAELLGIIMAYVVYKIANRDGACDAARKEQLERMSNLFVGTMMCIGGAAMILLAVLSEHGDKGNVIPALVIAVLGVVTNTIFWRRYTKLNQQEPDAILAVQARLYRAKSLVDTCVTIALTSVLVAPEAMFSYYVDTAGSIIVALYLVYCGAKTIRERMAA